MDTKGSDISPLAKLVVNAKIDALSFESDQLKERIEGFFTKLPKDMEAEKPIAFIVCTKFLLMIEKLFAQQSLWLSSTLGNLWMPSIKTSSCVL